MSLYLICLLLLLFLPKLNHLHAYKEASSRHRVELNNLILSVKQVLAHQRDAPKGVRRTVRRSPLDCVHWFNHMPCQAGR